MLNNIVRRMKPLAPTLTRCLAMTAEQRTDLEKRVKEDKVVVFMKGVPESPMCGFSNAVVKIFEIHGVDFTAHNVLDDEELRQNIKEFSDWPTIPQVYIDGEFVGGCDIMIQMHQDGELINILEKAGVKSLA